MRDQTQDVMMAEYYRDAGLPVLDLPSSSTEQDPIFHPKESEKGEDK
jgi:hypothetical protein